MFGYMTAITLTSPVVKTTDQRSISEKLGINQDLDTPFILFFQTNGEDISDHFFVSLKKDRIEESFLELKNHIKTAVDSISKVREENFGNHHEIFNLIKVGVKQSKINKFFSVNIFNKSNVQAFVKFIIGKWLF